MPRIKDRSNEDLINMRDAESLLQVSRSSIRRALARGELRGYKVGASYRIRRDDCERMLRAAGVLGNE